MRARLALPYVCCVEMRWLLADASGRQSHGQIRHAGRPLTVSGWEPAMEPALSSRPQRDGEQRTRHGMRRATSSAAQTAGPKRFTDHAARAVLADPAILCENLAKVLSL